MEFLFPWGWGELEGIANRTDYDLRAHAEASGVKLEYFDQATGERYVPYVIEPAAGATRTMMAFLLAAYDEDEIDGESRTVLRLAPPARPRTRWRCCRLSRKDTLVPVAREVLDLLQPIAMCDYDETQSIGRRYRRQDEIGTPLAVTDRLRLARGPGGDHPGPRHHQAGAGADRRPGGRDPGPPGLLIAAPFLVPGVAGATGADRVPLSRL